MSDDKIKGTYKEDEEEDTLFAGKSWTHPAIISIIMGTILIFIFRWKQPLVTYGQYDVYYATLLILVYFFMTMNLTLKHISPQLIADRLHTSTLGTPIDIGSYSAFTMGDIRSFNYRGGDGTIIVPRGQWESNGLNVNVRSPLEHIQPEELPFSIRREFLERGFPEPYYRGYVDASIIKNLPKISYLIQENKQLNRMNAMFEKLLDKKFKTTEEINQYVNRQLKELQETKAAAAKRFLIGGGGED